MWLTKCRLKSLVEARAFFAMCNICVYVFRLGGGGGGMIFAAKKCVPNLDQGSNIVSNSIT